MHWIICILVFLFSGCQGWSVLDRFEPESPPSVMLVWEQYQQCLAMSEPLALLQIVDQIERVMLVGPEPPGWMKAWGSHVMRQPLRSAVDPQALGAACTIRTAMVLAQQGRVPEARALYQRVVSRYVAQEWAYYHEQAKEALAMLPQTESAVVALRPPATGSGAQ